METLSGRQEPETCRECEYRGRCRDDPQKGAYCPLPLSLLDTKYTSARKRFRRMYHRVRSGLEKSGDVRLLTLTSSPQSGDFQRDFRMLIMRLRRRGLVTDYIRCPEKTATGLRHEHILFRGSYVEQAYLSHLWSKIHNAPVVDIRRVGGRHRLACYLANYLAKSPAGRYSYSWAWVWKGFAKSWKRLNAFRREGCFQFKEMLEFWGWCIRVGKKPEEVLPI